MQQIGQESCGNRLLQALRPNDFALIASHFSLVELDRGAVLVTADEPITAAWFLKSGLSSIIAMSRDTQGVEVGLAGRDGMVGLPLLLDCDRTPHRIFMQVGGSAYRIGADQLRTALDTSATLRKCLLRYVQVYATQTTYTALSNAAHTVEERLARWLLMSHDRQEGDAIALTHDFIALMLGVRRPTVTIALHSLEGLGFIRATRGLVTIRRRRELEEFADGAYGTPEAEYERLIGPLR
ncbi:MAG: Crp/Fnr family transcriptional regulator [Pseudomonas sp.]|nr:MAG: Crp/Fnr family transcriptional regulator [Pseudomonas sp.]